MLLRELCGALYFTAVKIMAEGGKASKPLDCQGSAGVVGSIKHKVGGSEKKDAGGQGVKKSVTKRVQTGPLASSRKIEHKGRAGGGQVQASPTVSDTTVKSKGDHEGRVGGAAQSLVFSEVCGDLFTCPASYSMAHCVSEDMAMGKGIAVLFKKKFGGVDQLKAQSKFGLAQWCVRWALFRKESCV